MIITTKTAVAECPIAPLKQITMLVQKHLRYIKSWQWKNCFICSPVAIIDMCKSMDRSHQPLIIALLGLVFFVNNPTFVTAATKSAVESVSSSPTIEPQHPNWFEFQRQTLGQPVQPAQRQSQEIGSIFSQFGLFIQSRQRNASELAGNIFFKYFNT